MAARRAQDSNVSGWCILIPFYNIYLFLIPGTTGENQYGLDPTQDEPTFDFEIETQTIR